MFFNGCRDNFCSSQNSARNNQPGQLKPKKNCLLFFLIACQKLKVFFLERSEKTHFKNIGTVPDAMECIGGKHLLHDIVRRNFFDPVTFGYRYGGKAPWGNCLYFAEFSYHGLLL